jgi:hypothetical protein
MTTKIILSVFFALFLSFAHAQDSTEVDIALSRGNYNYSVCYRYLDKHLRKNKASITVYQIFPKWRKLIGRTTGTTKDDPKDILSEFIDK